MEHLAIGDIHKAPNSPGLYQWFWRPLFSPHQASAALRARDEGDLETLSELIHTALIAPAVPLRYQVTMRGPLLPEYAGSLSARPMEAGALGERLMDGRRLEDFVGAINSNSWSFRQRLYLGKAREQTIRQRLNQHRSAMLEGTAGSELEDEEARNFAAIVRSRNIPLEALSITTQAIPYAAIDNIEYALNRILHPTLGRL